MNNFFRTTALAAAVAAATLSGGAHAASVVFASASFVDESVSNGDYYIDNTRYLGAIFTISTAEQLSAIGGNFTQYGDGNAIFGAIVPVAPGAALPGDIAAHAVASTVFTPTGGDQTAAIIGVLTPGTYALVFGSGLYGTSGESGLVSGQLPIGTPTFVQYGSSGGALTASAFTDDTLRVMVLATPVPEPSMAALWAGGALMLAWASRRRTP